MRAIVGYESMFGNTRKVADAIGDRADGPGLREWFATTHAEPAAAAPFSTRLDAPAVVTGSAAGAIARQLRRCGWALITKPESFRVTKQNRLVPGELERARTWARAVAASAQRSGIKR